MIAPRGITDISAATLEEIIQAYVDDGVEPQAARYMARMLKGEARDHPAS